MDERDRHEQYRISIVELWRKQVAELPRQDQEAIYGCLTENLKRAGEENAFRRIREFLVWPHLLFEEPGGRICQISGVARGEGLIWVSVVNHQQKGTHLDQWTFNRIVRVPKGYADLAE
jgi:hypothetical protein